VNTGGNMAKKITPSTGNVFEDLGFPKEEAENLRVRSALMATIRAILEEEGLVLTKHTLRGITLMSKQASDKLPEGVLSNGNGNGYGNGNGNGVINTPVDTGPVDGYGTNVRFTQRTDGTWGATGIVKWDFNGFAGDVYNDNSALTKSISPRPSNFSAPKLSSIVRESVLDATENAIRAGILALIKPVITSTLGLCVAKTK